MPDRYGDPDEPDEDERPIIVDQTVVDFESRRLDREAIANQQRESARLQKLAESRRTHAPLGRDQAEAIRKHRQAVTTTADQRRREQWIANCRLCDADGYRESGALCDHIDRSATHARGIALVRQTMGWDPPPEPTPLPVEAPAAPQPRTWLADPNSPDDDIPWPTEPDEPEGGW